MDTAAIATAILIVMIGELRVAVHRLSRRVRHVEGEQAKWKETHVLPAISALALFLLLSGCGGGVRPLDPGTPGHAAGSSIVALGNTCEWIGGITILVGAACWGLFKLAELGILVLESGALTLAGGFLFDWLGSHTWTFWLLATLGLVWFVYRRRTLVRRWLLHEFPQLKDVTDAHG